MRKLRGLAACLIVAWGLCPATAATPDSVVVENGNSAEICCQCDNCNVCGLCGRRCGCLCRSSRTSRAGYFNCQCQGSYKFPVPPQYTYHWPGMYSQQMMTEYYSPWRFPPLTLPQDVPALADAPDDSPEPKRLWPDVPSPVPEAPSKKMKRVLGVQ